MTLEDKILQLLKKEEANARQIYDMVGQPSVKDLMGALASLLDRNKIYALFFIRSSYGDNQRIAEFGDFLEIPKTMIDTSIDPPLEFNVGLNQVEVVWRIK